MKLLICIVISTVLVGCDDKPINYQKQVDESRHMYSIVVVKENGITCARVYQWTGHGSCWKDEK